MERDPVEAVRAIPCKNCGASPEAACGIWLGNYHDDEPYFCASRIRAALAMPRGEEEDVFAELHGHPGKPCWLGCTEPPPGTPRACETCGGEGVVFPSELKPGQPVIGETLVPCPTCTGGR